ncbi:MAG: hypothetical protein C3F07_03600 [Anaerolineales bacterium]|nr:MAG: hypothetical protein C3F07_03600 [Anaerolineales bacterium]
MKLTGKHYGIILSNIATAFLHITLFPDIMFTLNGVGYLGLLGAYFLPIPFFQERHKLVWWALVGYTALTIVLWVVMGDKTFVAGTSSATGYYAKAAEVILLAFLWADKPKS